LVDRESAAIEAIYAAVEALPSDAALRRRLAVLLVGAGRPEEALVQAEELLRTSPTDAEGLAVAAEAAEKAGLSERAEDYRSVLTALHRPIEPVGEGLIDDADPATSAPEPVKLFAVAGGGQSEVEVERPVVRLADVAGMEEVKRRLRTSFLAPLENPALRRMYGKSLRGGLLLYGPPGCGKTFIARAVAGELGAKFMAVGLHEVLDMYLGESERKLHELFENARREAPCVLFFDEVDAIGKRRTLARYSGGRDVIVQFLAELDSFGSNNDGVFVLAATNHPWDVDPALRRPGRFDRTLLVLPPDLLARQQILELNLRDRPTAEIDLPPIAEMTNLFSGADLAHVCETAAEYAIEDAIESGVPRPIETPDLMRAASELRPSTTAWLHTARNFAEFANEGGTYDDLLRFLREQRLP
jgi:SpoVK/Ycf46/Vps4 family AAA+-type ATPase